MSACVGVRREDKSKWERRVPVTPEDAAELQAAHGIQVTVQPSAHRAYTAEELAGVQPPPVVVEEPAAEDLAEPAAPQAEGA